MTGIPNPVVQVVSSNSDYYALDDIGEVWAWGASDLGEIGAGKITGAYVNTPTRVKFPAGVTIASLPEPMPYDTAMAIDANGDVWGWGANSYGQLCSSKTTVKKPHELSLGDVSLASGAGDHALYDSDGTVYACGANGFGDLGDGSMNANSGTAPVAVVGLPANEGVTSLQTACRDSGALMDDGSYYNWGLNSQGQLGDGDTVSSATPTEVPLQAPVLHVSQGGSTSGAQANGQTIAILGDGSVWTWGSGQYGQLGDGETANAVTPVPVDVPDGVSFAQVDSGGADEYALDDTGNAYAWGQNNDGQLGIGTTDAGTHDEPTALGLSLSEISATAATVYGLG